MCQAWVPRAPGSRGKTCGSRGSCSVWSAATLSQTMLSRFEHEVCVHSKNFAPALVCQRLFPDFLGALPRPAGDGACWQTLLVPPVYLGIQGGHNILGYSRWAQYFRLHKVGTIFLGYFRINKVGTIS